LWYDNFALGWIPAEDTAPAWQLLPQLCELRITAGLDPAEAHEWEAVLAGVSAATSLTKLELHVPYGSSWASQSAVCASLTGLTRLKDLCIDNCSAGMKQLAPDDVLALTALRTLTRLDLSCQGDGIVTAAAAALASSLTQLQHLDLQDCGLQLGTAEGLACLQAIGRLTQLTYLNLRHSGLTQHGLLQLTTLQCLRILNRFRIQDLDAFWKEGWVKALEAPHRRT
jgi:hypothetical protein